MKIINPHSHPVIKQIKACSKIPLEIKQLAIKDITRMITNDQYRLQVTKDHGVGLNYDISRFMIIDDVARLFRWVDSDLNNKMKDFWVDINDCLKIYPNAILMVEQC